MRAFKQVDVFGRSPFRGNPVAIIFDADDLSSAEMRSIARWTNLSETTFVCRPDNCAADYRLRIFTPREELPFAGHPTLGSAHAFRERAESTRVKGQLVQQCGVGLVRISVTGEEMMPIYTARMPDATVRPIKSADLSTLANALGVTPAVGSPPPARVDVGPVWIVAELADAETVLGLSPDLAKLSSLSERCSAEGVTVFGHDPKRLDHFQVRSFAPMAGVDEDPVCGSGNGSVGVWRARYSPDTVRGTRWTGLQGTASGRDGVVSVSVDEYGDVFIGGTCCTLLDGQIVC